MFARRSLWVLALTLSLGLISVSLSNWMSQRRIERLIAANDVRLTALHDELALTPRKVIDQSGTQRVIVEDVKRELQSEMGLLSVRMLRQAHESFVELNAYDNFGKLTYGTAGYLGDGYFITVKHAVIALDDDEGIASRQITSVKIRYKEQELLAHVVDSGAAAAEVNSGDWAIIKVDGELDLPPLRIDTSYAYAFADPIFRMGNDYSKGIILSTGYVGQRMSNGLVTCLTDGHPGVSGGGVLDQQGTLVGIPIGRMDGDYRFSFILPLRAEMFRKVPCLSLSMDLH
jgi:hypothetical protein